MLKLRTLIAAAALAPSVAMAQTQQQQDRIDAVAKYAVMSDACELFGAKYSEDLETAASLSLIEEGREWGIPSLSIKQKFDISLVRQKAMYGTDLRFASAHAKTNEQLRKIRDVLIPYSQSCAAADNDPTFGPLITLPADYDPTLAATSYADSLLEIGGLASWQTPEIQKRGDLAMLAGVCRRILGADRSDALMMQHGRSENARERDYYASAFQTGLDDTELDFNAAQCKGVIAANEAQLRKLTQDRP